METNPSSWHLCVSGQWGLANMDIGPRLRTTASNNCQAPVYNIHFNQPSSAMLPEYTLVQSTSHPAQQSIANLQSLTTFSIDVCLGCGRKEHDYSRGMLLQTKAVGYKIVVELLMTLSNILISMKIE